ncbi:MAG: MFS transporter [Deltaproteobacteria bacterium]|nr:MFS transporter [Deltaproteobacteria bacterium]
MPTARQTSGKVFYGWWVVLAAGVGLALHIGPIIVSTFGVFFKPLSQEFGWSRAEVSLAFSLLNLEGIVVVPVIGRLVDRLGARRVIVPSVLFFGLGIMSLYFLTASLWHFYALYLVLGVGGGGTSPVGYSKVIAHWFDKKRGLALALAISGVSLGGFIMPPLAQALITAVGWRQAYVVLGLLTVAGTLPVVGLLLKESPQLMGLAPDGGPGTDAGRAASQGQEYGLRGAEAWHTAAFWLMAGAFFLVSVSFLGFYIHLVPLLTDRGVSPQSAALAMSVASIGGFVGRLGCGYLLDRFFAPYVAVGFFGGSALGIFLLWGGAVGGGVFVAVVLVGLGLGAEFDVMPYMVSRYFGLRAFGEIYSYAFAAFGLGGVIGPLLMGAGFDATGSYQLALGGFVMLPLLAAGLLTQLGPYRVWEVGVEPAVAADVSRA